MRPRRQQQQPRIYTPHRTLRYPWVLLWLLLQEEEEEQRLVAYLSIRLGSVCLSALAERESGHSEASFYFSGLLSFS